MTDQRGALSLHAVARQHAIARRTAWGLTVLWAIFMTLFAWQSWLTNRQSQLETVTSMVELGANAMSHYFGRYRAALNGVSQATLLMPGQPTEVNAQSAQLLVQRASQRIADLEEIYFLSPSGEVLASTKSGDGQQSAAASALEPSLVASLTAMPRDTVFAVGQAVYSPDTNNWVVPLRHVVRARHGKVMGLLVAAVSVRALEALWKGVPVTHDVAFGVLGHDGYLRVRYPVFGHAVPEEVYGKPRTGRLIAYLRESNFPPRGVVVGYASVDKLQAINVFARIEGLPLVFFAVLPMATVTEAWVQAVVGPLTAFLFLTIMGWWILRRQLQEQKVWLAEQAQLQLVSSELANIVTASRDAIVGMTREGLCNAWNPAAEQLLGYSRADMAGIYADMLVPAHFKARERAMELSVLQGEPVPPLHSQRMRKDGHLVDVEVSVSPVRDVDGVVVGTSHVLRDISARIKADQDLRIADHAFASISQGLIIAGPDERIIKVNPAFLAISGFEASEVLGQTCRFLQGRDTDPHAVADIRSCLALKVAFQGEILNYRKDGTPFWNELSIEPLHTPRGKFSHFVAVVRDVTTRREFERVRQEAAVQIKALSGKLMGVQEAERRHLALELHDELGQALTALKINLQTRSHVAANQLAEADAHNLQIVETTIRQVRAMALELRPSVLDDLGLVAALEWLVGQKNGLGGVAMQFVCESLLERTGADIETAAFRIAQEAITNVLRHAHASELVIHLGGDAQTLILTIRDNGQGFDLPVARGRGTGPLSLGLAGMRDRAEMAGGTLQVVTRPGEGCTVRFTCALTPAQEQAT